MGWDELMETLKKRFEEQKERHEGGSRMIGTGGTSPFAAATSAAPSRFASSSGRVYRFGVPSGVSCFLDMGGPCQPMLSLSVLRGRFAHPSSRSP
jgi:hypothetical protein